MATHIDPRDLEEEAWDRVNAEKAHARSQQPVDDEMAGALIMGLILSIGTILLLIGSVRIIIMLKRALGW